MNLPLLLTIIILLEITKAATDYDCGDKFGFYCIDSRSFAICTRRPGYKIIQDCESVCVQSGASTIFCSDFDRPPSASPLNVSDMEGNGDPVGRTCNPSASKCNADGVSLKTCNNGGTGWTDQTCPTGTFCKDDNAKNLAFCTANFTPNEGITQVIVNPPPPPPGSQPVTFWTCLKGQSYCASGGQLLVNCTDTAAGDLIICPTGTSCQTLTGSAAACLYINPTPAPAPTPSPVIYPNSCVAGSNLYFCYNLTHLGICNGPGSALSVNCTTSASACVPNNVGSASCIAQPNLGTDCGSTPGATYCDGDGYVVGCTGAGRLAKEKCAAGWSCSVVDLPGPGGVGCVSPQGLKYVPMFS